MNKKNILIYFGSFCFLLGFSIYGFFEYQSSSVEKNGVYPIKVIVQTTTAKEKLKTELFAQLLELNKGTEIDLNQFDLEKGKEKILGFPLIKNVSIKKIYPESLQIAYDLKTPLFFLADFENVAMDDEGSLFPIEPYLSPKKLPIIQLGISFNGWDKKVEDRRFTLVKELMFLLNTQTELEVKKIDVSNAYSSQYGKREILLRVEEKLFNGHHIFYFPFLLRLNPNHFEKQLSNFLELQKKMLKDYEKQLESLTESKRFEERVIDLRIEDLALIEK